MSKVMRPLPFNKIINRIVYEYIHAGQIFGIPKQYFYHPHSQKENVLFGHTLDTPIGPAAGPHTQLAQNIISAYLVGGRFFELKTVQFIDTLDIDKPCIDAFDECYNTEWSQELSLTESYDEYIKAWFALHFINLLHKFNSSGKNGFIFNMSIGYDLLGIKSLNMTRFISDMINASDNSIFNSCKRELIDFCSTDKNLFNLTKHFNVNIKALVNEISCISPFISSSVTLSTMHGCPKNEIEEIGKYLITEKKLNTFIKLNPTLAGYDFVKSVLNNNGYDYIKIQKTAFTKDLHFNDAVNIIKNLSEYANKNKVKFGIKLSNTLPVKNDSKYLHGAQKYLSGKALYPITLNLANKLSIASGGSVHISFSGGVNAHNVKNLIECGIYPITLVTDILKPGGYLKLNQIASMAEHTDYQYVSSINSRKLSEYSVGVLSDNSYYKMKDDKVSKKHNTTLELFDCFIAPCVQACPIHQSIPEYIWHVNSGKYLDAFSSIIKSNPLPFITGYICDHQCMYSCTRLDYDKPVSIREIKKEAAIKGYDEYIRLLNNNRSNKASNAKVAIIGAGPAGLSAAYFLVQADFSVTIFEKKDKAGGAVQYTIPGFRIPQEAIDKDIDFIKIHGVQFMFNVQNITVNLLKEQGYKYIIISTGAEIPIELKIDNSDSSVINAIDFLRNCNHNKIHHLGKNVAVIGGGNTAMDSARAALRIKGVEKVHIIYRRTKKYMPADLEEYEAALKEGVVFHELLLPVEYKDNKLKCQAMMLVNSLKDKRKQVRPVTDKYESFEIDTVISAIGESVDKEFLKANNITEKRSRHIQSSELNGKAGNNVFLIGDAQTGPATVVKAIAGGKNIAEYIIQKEKQSKITKPDIERKNAAIIEYSLSEKGKVYNYESIENNKCLNCNSLCTKCVDVCPNRANMAINTISEQLFNDAFQIVHIDSICNECGNCYTFCPHNGAPYKDKLTYFDNAESYKASNNPGFYFLDVNNKDVKLRINNNEYIIGLSDKQNEYHLEKARNLINIFANEYEYIL